MSSVRLWGREFHSLGPRWRIVNCLVIRSVVISISSIICVYLAISNKGGVKRMRKDVIMI